MARSVRKKSDHPVAKYFQGCDGIADRCIEDKAELRGARGQCLHRLVGAAHPDIEGYVRILRVEAVKDRRHKTLDSCLETADVDAAGVEILQRGDMRFDARELTHHAVDLRKQNLSGGSEFHALSAAVKHWRTKLVLKLRDLAADRRRGDMKPVGCGADRTRVSGGAEVAKCGEIHMRHLHCAGRCTIGNIMVRRLKWRQYRFGSIVGLLLNPIKGECNAFHADAARSGHELYIQSAASGRHFTGPAEGSRRDRAPHQGLRFLEHGVAGSRQTRGSRKAVARRGFILSWSRI